jgi:hypothetical protein
VTRISGLLLCICAALALAGAAQGGLAVGVTEDAGKAVAGGAPFFATMANLGLTVNRVSIAWDPAQKTAIPAPGEIHSWLPQARVAGVRIIFAVAPLHARDLTASPAAPAEFVAFIEQLARSFPMVKDYVIGNEPNQPRFWLPQFSAARKPLSAAAYEPVLARAYDALKAINPAIRVIGVGLSPRGNDQPAAKNNVSRSPVRFLQDLGVAYRASHRTKPLMDGLAFHPYPSSSRDTLDKGYPWPNAGVANLDRLKQAVWDAFHGTSQPTFAETGIQSKFAAPLTFDLDEVGWQVAIPAGLASFYFGAESVPTTDEATQAQIYADLIKLSECDSTVRSLSFFHLVDEADLNRWQSGLERADGSHRPSYDAVKQTLAQTHGDCQGPQKTWIHTTKVVSASVAWGNLRRARPRSKRRWGFTARAGEEATFRAGLFKARPRPAVLVRGLGRGRPKPVLGAKGTIKANSRLISFPARKLKPGRYIYVIRMVSTMNPHRVSGFVSRVFRVSAKRR